MSTSFSGIWLDFGGKQCCPNLKIGQVKKTIGQVKGVPMETSVARA